MLVTDFVFPFSDNVFVSIEIREREVETISNDSGGLINRFEVVHISIVHTIIDIPRNRFNGDRVVF